jgi:hypothetical protein
MTSVLRTGAFLFAAAILGIATGAGAQEKPCMADAAKLCPGVEPGGGAQIKCLKSHMSELSPGCKEKVAAMKEKFQKKEQQEAMPPSDQPPSGEQPSGEQPAPQH